MDLKEYGQERILLDLSKGISWVGRNGSLSTGDTIRTLRIQLVKNGIAYASGDITISGICCQSTSNVALVSSCNYAKIERCILESTAKGGYGILASKGSVVRLAGVALSNCSNAVNVQEARVISSTLTGSSNTNGYCVEVGGILHRLDATKPGGASDVVQAAGLLVNASGGIIGS